MVVREGHLAVDGRRVRIDRPMRAAELHDATARLHGALEGAVPVRVIRLAEALIEQDGSGRSIAYLLLGKGWGSAARIRTRRVEALGGGIEHWHHSDLFSAGVAGPAWREGRLTDAAVRRWTRSAHVMWRRNALVSTVALNARSWGGRGDARRTVEICARLVGDHDGVTQKALSWALRVLIAVDREAVERFLSTHDDALAARVRREVRTKLDTGVKRRRR